MGNAFFFFFFWNYGKFCSIFALFLSVSLWMDKLAVNVLSLWGILVFIISIWLQLSDTQSPWLRIRNQIWDIILFNLRYLWVWVHWGYTILVHSVFSASSSVYDYLSSGSLLLYILIRIIISHNNDKCFSMPGFLSLCLNTLCLWHKFDTNMHLFTWWDLFL